MKSLDHVLLLYKKSAYDMHFRRNTGSVNAQGQMIRSKAMKRFQVAHHEHYDTLKKVEQVLRSHNISYSKKVRVKGIPYARYTAIITIGGDGTFLEAARGVKQQLIIGVNSSPTYSVGKFCIVHAGNFEKVLQRFILKKYKIKLWQRLRLEHPQPLDVLNDILISQGNPAAMSRYFLYVAGKEEEQYSSGLWISTAMGSSGAIRSAGGRLIAACDKKFQYMPRELYYGKRKRYFLKGGILNSRQVISITSLMHNAKIFIDGAHLTLPFPYGERIKVRLSPNPVRTLQT